LRRGILLQIGVCNPAPPSTASAAALAYLRAIDAASPAWRNVDATLTAEGFMTPRYDLITQVNADVPNRL
jgi:hypothetical protein